MSNNISIYWPALSRVIGIKKGDIVSLVGGGGKTSSMFLMARELCDQGLRVIVTTTTHIFPPDPPVKTVFGNETETIRKELAENGLIVLADGFKGERLQGIDPFRMEELITIADVILVEADGANCLPFKAPLDHEPVIPPSSTIVIPIAGLDVLGRTLSKEHCHRPERIAEIMNMNAGDVITAETVAGVILHSRGGMKGVPSRARVVPILNKADSPGDISNAMKISGIMEKGGIKRSVITSLQSDPPFIRPCGKNSRVAAVILAAGGSSRMGRPKLEMEIEGKTLVQKVLEGAAQSMAGEIIVVSRPGFTPVDKSFCSGLKIVENEKWKTGQSSSMKRGLESVSHDMEAVLFLMADQPFITPEVINELLLRYMDTEAPIVAPLYRGEKGSPVLFDRSLFNELFMVEGDRGGRDLLNKYPVEYVNFDSSVPGMDIDTPEDYEKVSKLRNTKYDIR